MRRGWPIATTTICLAAGCGSATPTTTAGPDSQSPKPGLLFTGALAGQMSGISVDCGSTQFFGPYVISAQGSVAGQTVTLLVYLDDAGDMRTAHVKVFQGRPGGPIPETPQWEVASRQLQGLSVFNQTSGLTLSSNVPAVPGSGASGSVGVSGSVACPPTSSASPSPG